MSDAVQCLPDSNATIHLEKEGLSLTTIGWPPLSTSRRASRPSILIASMQKNPPTTMVKSEIATSTSTQSSPLEASTPTANSPNLSPKSGLSSQALKIGVGVGASGAVVLIFAFAFVLCINKCRVHNSNSELQNQWRMVSHGHNNPTKNYSTAGYVPRERARFGRSFAVVRHELSESPDGPRHELMVDHESPREWPTPSPAMRELTNRF